MCMHDFWEICVCCSQMLQFTVCTHHVHVHVLFFTCIITCCSHSKTNSMVYTVYMYMYVDLCTCWKKEEFYAIHYNYDLHIVLHFPSSSSLEQKKKKSQLNEASTNDSDNRYRVSTALTTVTPPPLLPLSVVSRPLEYQLQPLPAAM